MQIYYDDDDRDDCYFKEGGDEKPKDLKEKYKEETENFKMDFAGIKRERGCTDIFCLILFWLFIGCMGYATMYGYKNGEINKLTAPINADGKFCGFGETKDYPKMILTDFDISLLTGILQTGVCVKTCPKDKDQALVDCQDNKKKKCAEHKSYPTTDVFDFCLPTKKSDLPEKDAQGFEELIKFLENSRAGSFYQDLYKSSTSVFIAMGLALVWSVVYIYLMSWFAEYLAWCCVILIWCGLGAGTYFATMEWLGSKKLVNEYMAGDEYKDKTREQKDKYDETQGKYPQQMMWVTIVMGILCVCFSCAVICGRESLKRAIDVIDASADYIAHNKRVILVPNLHFIFTLIFSIIWAGAFMCVVSLNEIKPDTLIPQGRDLIWDKKIWYASLFMFFGFLWITAWIEYTSRFIVIMGAATYYFNNSRAKMNEEAPGEIGYGFKCAYVNHMGSIAFGAFIIAVIRFIKICLYYIAKKMESSTGENAAVKAAVKCAICLLNCIEKICDYLNETAFCYMAVTGDHFLSSAWSGFLLNLKHGLKFAFAQMLAKAFIFIGKVGIVVGNMVTLYFLMKSRGDLKEVTNIEGPFILVGLVSFMAGSMFLSLFDEAVQALLVCLCVDIDASPDGDPIYGPATFHDGYVASETAKEES